MQCRDQRLADPELTNDLGDVELGVGHEGLGRRADRLLIARGVGAQGVLDAITELAEDLVGHVVGKLRAEVHAHTLGADEPHDLLDPLAQRRGRVVEQQVSLVEAEHQLGLVEVAHFGEVLEQLGQQPEQEARIQPWLQDELVGGEDVHDAATAEIRAHHVGELERRLTKEGFPAFPLQRQQGALDGRHRGGVDQPVLRGDLLAVVGDEGQQGAQIVEVEQQQAAVVGQLERDLQHTGLGIVELQDAPEQARAYLADRSAHGMAGLTVEIPEHDGTGLGRVALDPDLGHTLVELLVGGARHGQARDITLHVGHEHRHAQTREAFCQHHQGDGLAGAGGARHQAMAVTILGQQMNGLLTLADENLAHPRGS